jgi:hypothetical protein
MNDLQAARGLGLFSVGLGLTQLMAPRWLGETTGVGDYRTLMRTLGARELASGIGVLARRRPAGPLWARLAGDVVDVALLGWALWKSARRGRVATALAMVLGVGLLDYRYACRMAR